MNCCNTDLLSPSEWIASVSTLIALIAVCYAVWQGCEQRRHNKLSVKPFLKFSWRLTEANKCYELLLDNAGLGPAVITGFKLKMEGIYPEHKTVTDNRDVAQKFNLTGSSINIGCFRKDEVILPKDSGIIFKLTPECFGTPPPENAALLGFKDLLRQCDFIVEYKSIYGDRDSERFVGSTEPL